MSEPAPFALVGWPLDFSLSPAMHRAALAEAGLAGDYLLRPTRPEDLTVVLDALRRGELAGLNVTVPHKVALLPRLEEASELALGLGAVNTVLRRPEGSLRGENTDGVGFRFALEEAGALDGRGRQALLLGAGGAARAAAYVLLRAGYALTVLARRSGQSGILAAQMHRVAPGGVVSTALLDAEGLARRAPSADLLVNATPLGGLSAPEASPWPEGLDWPSGLALIDLVAWPPVTPLLAGARAAGAPAWGGLTMLAAQAARSFKLWTGRDLPWQLFREAALTEARRLAAERGAQAFEPGDAPPPSPPNGR